MRISTGTIDCWLYVGQETAPYYDFQHHHWDIMSSGPITNMLGNNTSYTWTLIGKGHDGTGHWSAVGQSRVSNAVVRTANSTTVNITQPSFGANKIWVAGSNNSTNHNVSELIWPNSPDTPILTWSPSLPVPTSVVHQDIGLPTHRVVIGPHASSRRGVPTLVPDSGFGGRDYTLINHSYFFQKPMDVMARAWWAWNINLIP